MKKFNEDTYGGHFGKWYIDEFGLPVYEYTCHQLKDPIAKTRTTGKDSIDHFHQIGNDQLNITAHNGGYIQVFTGNRGFQWISYLNPLKNCFGGGLLTITENDEMWMDIFTNDFSDSNQFRRIFGSGYFKKVITKNNLVINHIICPIFGDEPFILSDIEIKNESDRPREFKIGYYYGIRMKSLVGSLLSNLYMTKERKDFGIKIISFIGRILKILLLFIGQGGEQIRERFASKFKYEGIYKDDLGVIILRPIFKSRIPKDINEIADRNYYPKSVFLVELNNKPDYYYNFLKIYKNRKGKYTYTKKFEKFVNLGSCIMLEKTTTLEPGEVKKFQFLFGYLEEEFIENKVKEFKNTKKLTDYKTQLKKWKENLIEFKFDELKWLNREVKWHSHYLKSAFLYDDYFKSHYITQGNAYTYLHGLNGAIRDFILFNYSIIFMNPEMAKQFLIYIFRTMGTNGIFPYAIKGFGQEEGAVVHESSSDLGIFLLWGLLDYIYLTRDFEFLNEEILFYPINTGKKSTVYERIILILNFLLNNIGFGEHGLIRACTGDWSDGISMFVPNRSKFIKKGESNFNSAFFLYIIPNLLSILERYKKLNPNSKSLISKLKEIYKDLKQSCLETWNGRWYYRGYDGIGGAIGDKNIFLEHHPWIILSDIFPKNNIKILINNIYNILDKPSKIGQYVCYPPNKTLLNIIKSGTAENGGIWYAMNFLMTWAYSKIDREKALSSLIKNSMLTRAKIYPNIWYGIWSGSDSYNADYTEFPGHTFVHPLTPQTDFPIMNMNIHANFLNSVIKLIGIESNYNTISINPVFNLDFHFKSKLMKIKYDKEVIDITVNFIKEDKIQLKIRLPNDFKDNITVKINDIIKKEYKILENFIYLDLLDNNVKNIHIEILKI
ncbi:MAG: GH36-type glycosyl hydrolase domain-containing protein [Candidatus Helarchaeota archaeon]